MQYPDYYKKYDRLAPAKKPAKPWGGYRRNAGRKHSWAKQDYPLSKLALPQQLAERIRTLRDSNVSVNEMLFKLED